MAVEEDGMEPLLKRSLLRSLLFSAAATAAIYVTALGFLTTHEEVDVPARSAWPIAAWAFPVLLLLSLAYFAVRDAGSRK
jgi:hypothetical protein